MADKNHIKHIDLEPGIVEKNWKSAEAYMRKNKTFSLVEQITEILASCLSDNDVKPRTQEVFDAFCDAGYVRLAEDQSLPKTPVYSVFDAYEIAQQDMLKVGFRKIKE